jgi:N-carbamoylputrescine amidase
VKVALAQITGEPFAVEQNRELARSVAAEAIERSADLVVLPELIDHGYVADRERLAQLAEPVLGPTFESWHELARAGDAYVVGGFCERAGDDLYNSAIAVGPEGLVLHYRKVHLFAAEKLAFRPGDVGFPVAPTRIGTIGLCVCYDLRFVEVVRIMSLRGADVICVPTAWVAGFDQERWDADGMCPQAHGAVLQANLNQVFIACASQAGRAGELDFLGSSVFADPYGKRVLGPLPGGEAELAIAEIDVSAATRAQVRDELISPRRDRRTDVYGIWTAEGDVL